MKPSDCPYPVGTPEHSAWINDVLIPHQSRDLEFLEAEDKRAGASSIGGKLIIENQPIVPTYAYQVWKKAILNELEKQLKEAAGVAEEFEESFEKVNQVYREFSWDPVLGDLKGVEPVGIILDEGDLDLNGVPSHKQHQKIRKQTCIPHGEPKGSCRKCARKRK